MSRAVPSIANDTFPLLDPRMGTVRLPDGRPFHTTVYELDVIGQLRAATKLPYYILSGRGCADCDANISIYVHSPSDGPMKVEAEQPRFPYPGTEIFFDDGTPLYEASMFYGDCVEAYPNAVIWFQRRWVENTELRESVLIVQVRGDSLVQTELRSSLPAMADVHRAVQRGACEELEGMERTSEP